MYISEISKSKISDHKAPKMIILQILKVGSLIMGHPVFHKQTSALSYILKQKFTTCDLQFIFLHCIHKFRSNYKSGHNQPPALTLLGLRTIGSFCHLEPLIVSKSFFFIYLLEILLQSVIFSNFQDDQSPFSFISGYH